MTRLYFIFFKYTTKGAIGNCQCYRDQKSAGNELRKRGLRCKLNNLTYIIIYINNK